MSMRWTHVCKLPTLHNALPYQIGDRRRCQCLNATMALSRYINQNRRQHQWSLLIFLRFPVPFRFCFKFNQSHVPVRNASASAIKYVIYGFSVILCCVYCVKQYLQGANNRIIYCRRKLMYVMILYAGKTQTHRVLAQLLCPGGRTHTGV